MAKPKPSPSTGILDLSSELLVELFKYLPIQDIHGALRRVCPRFNAIVKEHFQIDCVRLYSWDHNFFKFRRYLNVHKVAVKKMMISTRRSEQDLMFAVFKMFHPALEELDIDLDIVYLEASIDELLPSVFRKCPQLRKITISYCTYESLRLVLKRASPRHLTEIRFGRLVHRSWYSPETAAWPKLAKFKNLTHLDVPPKVPPEFWGSVSTLKNLESMELSWLSKATRDSFNNWIASESMCACESTSRIKNLVIRSPDYYNFDFKNNFWRFFGNVS